MSIDLTQRLKDRVAIITGGASGMPMLRDRISAVLPAARRVQGDLFGSIGAGLALDAARKFG